MATRKYRHLQRYDEARLRRLYGRGETLESIGSMYGVTRARMHQVFRCYGISRRPSNSTSSKRENQVVRYLESGKTGQWIKYKMHMSTSTISRIAKQYGIWEPRQPHELDNPKLLGYFSKRLKMTPLEISAAMNTSLPTVYRLLRKHSIPVQPRVYQYPKLHDKSWLSEMLYEYSQKQIAHMLGCSPGMIYHWKKRHGL